MNQFALKTSTSCSRNGAAILVGIAVFCMFALLAQPAAAAPAGSGGSMFVSQPLRAPSGAFAGKATVLRGSVESGAGNVSITARRGRADFLPVGIARADADGNFRFRWTPPKSGRYDFRLVPAGASAAAADEVFGRVSVYRRQKATWYGPGFYGRRTACGQKLTRRTLGVAHKTLPCGTRVEFFLRGRRITVPVIDRGPFANHAVWDLTLAAMKRLGSSSTEVLGALPQP